MALSAVLNEKLRSHYTHVLASFISEAAATDAHLRKGELMQIEERRVNSPRNGEAGKSVCPG